MATNGERRAERAEMRTDTAAPRHDQLPAFLANQRVLATRIDDVEQNLRRSTDETVAKAFDRTDKAIAQLSQALKGEAAERDEQRNAQLNRMEAMLSTIAERLHVAEAHVEKQAEAAKERERAIERSRALLERLDGKTRAIDESIAVLLERLAPLEQLAARIERLSGLEQSLAADSHARRHAESEQAKAQDVILHEVGTLRAQLEARGSEDAEPVEQRLQALTAELEALRRRADSIDVTVTETQEAAQTIVERMDSKKPWWRA